MKNHTDQPTALLIGHDHRQIMPLSLGLNGRDVESLYRCVHVTVRNRLLTDQPGVPASSPRIFCCSGVIALLCAVILLPPRTKLIHPAPQGRLSDIKRMTRVGTTFFLVLHQRFSRALEFSRK